MGSNHDEDVQSAGRPLASGSASYGDLSAIRGRVEAARIAREPDITAVDERGLARDPRVAITETVDEGDGTSRVRHVGDDAQTHGVLLTQRAITLRERDAQQQRTKRQLAWATVVLLIGFAVVVAFAPETMNAYIGAGVLLIAAGAFGVKSFRIKLKDFELAAGEDGLRLPPPERPAKKR